MIANFSAAWCGPCKMIAPYYCELSEKYTSMMFLVVDVDELTVSTEAIDIIILLFQSYFVRTSIPLYLNTKQTQVPPAAKI